MIFYLALTDRRTGPTEGFSLDGIDRNYASVFLDEDQQKVWRECRPIIGEMVLTPIAQIVAKATDLAFDFARLCVRARILTDVRPVFTEARDAIVGAAITQTLRVDYTSPDGDDQTISFALDEKDLKALFNACSDALQKAAKARNLIEESGRDAIIVGEDAG